MIVEYKTDKIPWPKLENYLNKMATQGWVLREMFEWDPENSPDICVILERVS